MATPQLTTTETHAHVAAFILFILYGWRLYSSCVHGCRFAYVLSVTETRH